MFPSGHLTAESIEATWIKCPAQRQDIQILLGFTPLTSVSRNQNPIHMTNMPQNKNKVEDNTLCLKMPVETVSVALIASCSQEIIEIVRSVNDTCKKQDLYEKYNKLVIGIKDSMPPAVTLSTGFE